MRYIHLSPLRAGLVADIRALGKHPYCNRSYSCSADRPAEREFLLDGRCQRALLRLESDTNPGYGYRRLHHRTTSVT
jgi:hypothetical protein